MALDKLQNLAVDDLIKQQVGDVLKAAANADHSKPDVIVRSLPEDRQKLIHKTARQMKTITDDVMTRGKQRLLDMSDDEWERIVNESTD